MKGPMLGLFLIFLILAGCSSDQTSTNNLTGAGGQPQIAGVTPNQANPGQQDIEGRIHGSNLNGATSVSLGDGVRIERFSSLSATEVYVVFSVPRDAAPGPRTVTVQTSGGVATSSGTFSISDNRLPVAFFTVNPPFGIKGTFFQFDASKSSDSDGNIVSYTWDFGDRASASGRSVKHQFRNAGTFEVKLNVTDNRNATDRTSKIMDVTRSKPPVARFTVSPSSGDTTTTFRFDASRSHDPDGKLKNYLWNFGDGSSEHGSVAEHRYTFGRSYSVTLTVSDNTGMTDLTDEVVPVREGPGGGGGGGGGGQGACTQPAANHGFIYGTVVRVEGNNAIVRLPQGSTCANSFYRCGDMRRADPEEFRGIIMQMSDLGDGTFSIFNDCPAHWPPDIGETVFLYFKKCSENFCP